MSELWLIAAASSARPAALVRSSNGSALAAAGANHAASSAARAARWRIEVAESTSTTMQGRAGRRNVAGASDQNSRSPSVSLKWIR